MTTKQVVLTNTSTMQVEVRLIDVYGTSQTVLLQPRTRRELPVNFSIDPTIDISPVITVRETLLPDPAVKDTKKTSSREI